MNNASTFVIAGLVFIALGAAACRSDNGIGRFCGVVMIINGAIASIFGLLAVTAGVGAS